MKRQLLITFFLLGFVLVSNAQISGSVFRDYNGNGIKNNTATLNEPFVSGITVNVYNASNALVATTTTAGTVAPNYSFTGVQVPFPGSYRVEFVGFGTAESPAVNGTGNGTNVQFVNATSTTVHYAVAKQSESYITANPDYAAAQFVQNSTSAANANRTIFDIAYDGTGTVTEVANRGNTGSVWGLAYDKKTKRLFASAFLKRHAQLGPLGLGGIYEIDYTNSSAPVVSNWLNINTLAGVNTGTTTRPGGVNYMVDAEVYGEVGKIGIGDIDLSDNGDTMYVMNLNNNGQVVVINRTTKALIATYAVPNPGCGAGSDVRPFALKYYNGALYVGVICSGQSAPANTNFYVYKLQGGSFTAVLSNNLNYPKGWVHATYVATPTLCSSWETWSDNFADVHVAGSSAQGPRWCRPQAMLTDIEFDETGSMMLGFADRTGHQLGYQARNTADNTTGNGYSGGDLLRAAPNAGNYTLESNGTSNGITTTGAGTGEGPGGGEYYYQDNYLTTHEETTVGGLAHLPGTQEVLSSSFDPSATVFAGGTITLSNTTGAKTRNYESFVSAAGTAITFGKAAGMGDIELLTDFAPIQIGNRIWYDTNGNGIQDAGENTTVPAGTTVTLRSPGLDGFYGGADDQTWTTTTTATGNYYFSALSSADNRKPATWSGIGNIILPGYSYRVELTIPAGYQITKANVSANGFDNIDNDATISGTNAVILFTTGTTDHNFDIGLKPLASLGDKVWLDNDKDGVQQAAEPGVSGITVTLKNNVGTVVATTVTDAFGNYLFDNLTAGDYTVTVTLPANYTFTTQTNTTDDNNTTGPSTTGSDVNVTTGQSYTVTLSAGENNRNADAGIVFNVPAASNSLGDKVWYDVNSNGVQDGTEPGVAGVTVILYASNGTTVIATTITDANGNYIFNNLPAATDYIVGVTPPAGMVFTSTSGTTPGNATTNSDVDATPGSATYGKTAIVNSGVAGTQITGIDAGIIPQAAVSASLGDRVWNDLNSNGTQDAGEPGIAGVTVNLYEDVNGDGVIAGAELVAVRTTITDPFGYYNFNNLLVTGLNKWQVEFVQPAGYTNTPVANNNSGNDATDSDITNNATDRTDLVRLFYSERNTKTDAGFVQTAPAGALKLGDKVWRDDNGDGQQLATEPGVAGVTAKLYQNGTDGLPGTADDVLLNSTVTDINGDYLFVSLAASTNAATNYNVQFSNLPAGFSFTAADAGADATDNDANTAGKTGSYNLTADNLTVDAGIVIGVPSGLGSLGDKVWYDLSNNGIQDAGELGAAGVTVNLFLDANGDGQITGGEQTPAKTTTTNAMGEYMFDGLNAGSYQVGFTLPAALSTYTLSAKDAGTSDALDSDGNPKNTSVSGNVAGAQTSYTALVTLAQGEDKLTVDLGIVPPAATNTLGGTAWFDTDNNGTQTGNPGRVPGVVVNLYNNAGTLIATTTTDKNGDYLFVGLADGNYSVAFAAYPAGFDITTKSATNDATGSDADLISGRTTTVTLNAGNRNDRTLDAGLISTRAALGNKVWEDLDGDGIQDAGEPGIAGVTVTLWQDITTQMASAVTDENGYYFFPNLNADPWQVGFTTTPAGLSFTVKDNTTGPDGDGANTWTGGGDSDVNTSGINTGKTDVFILAAGEVNLTVDAGLRRTPIATVGNRVWDDININGIQDPTEPGIPGVIATLYNNANQPIGSAVTDGSGNWLITNVPVGTGYYVIFTNKPLGDFTIQDVGGAGTGGGTDTDTDSDVNTAGQSGTFDVAANTVNVKIDAGIIQSQTLPVRLVSFTAKPQGEKVALQWNVAEQVNITSYTLEYSTNGVSFNTLETVAANTNANAVYNTVHTAPLKGINYYRLKINEPAGRYSYSDIRTVKFTDAGTITVSPNPFMEKIDISISSVSAQEVVISMIDAKGRVVKQSRAALAKGTNLVPVYSLQALAPGVYIVSVQSVNGTIAFTHKLVKE